MARSRNIKPGFFTNEELGDSPALTRLLFIGLWTIADKAGRLLDRPRKIKAEVLPYEDISAAEVDAMLTDLAERGFLIRYYVDGVSLLQIVNWEKHQKPYHREPDSSLPEPQQSTGEARPKPCSNTDLPVSGIRNQESRNLEGGAGGNNLPPAPADHFDQWWESVHLKKAKREAKAAYEKAVKLLRKERPGSDPHAFLLERMVLFAGSPEATPDDHSPIHPATWLNKGRYDDDPATWHRQRGSPANNHRQSTSETVLALLNQP